MRACRGVPVFYFPTQLNLFCQIPHSLLTEGNPNSMSRHSQRLPLSPLCKTIRGDLFYALNLLSVAHCLEPLKTNELNCDTFSPTELRYFFPDVFEERLDCLMSVGVEFDPASLLSFIQTVDMVEYLKVSGLTFIFRAHFQSSAVPVF